MCIFWKDRSVNIVKLGALSHYDIKTPTSLRKHKELYVLSHIIQSSVTLFIDIYIKIITSVYHHLY